MKNPFSPGDTKHYRIRVSEAMLARFDAGEVHPVYGTFALGRDAEWVCRLFVLEMKEEGEEGIGTYLSVEHVSPALLGSEVVFTGILEEIEGREIWCSFEARVGERLIARGRTGQKIIDKKRFNQFLKNCED
jgi:predicted thioesterase